MYEHMKKHFSHSVECKMEGGRAVVACNTCNEDILVVSSLEDDWTHQRIESHAGHHVVCAMYGDEVSYSIECEDCNEVIFDSNLFDDEEEE